MISSYLASEVRRYSPGSCRGWLRGLRKLFEQFVLIVIQPLTPYESTPPQPKNDIPRPPKDLPKSQLAQCQAIFEEAQDRREHIERKAQWTFAAIAILIPFHASASLFLILELPLEKGIGTFLFVLLLFAALFLILSFLSAARALSVQPRQFLFIKAIINEDGTFRKYKRHFHARGLLYCASTNTAMNDHIAQFVKGAQVLMVLAALLLVTVATAELFMILFSDNAQGMLRPAKIECIVSAEDY